jgi:hypothetical protein
VRIAIIRDGVVLNVIIADEDFVPDDGYSAVETDIAGPGWLYDGTNFTAPDYGASQPEA